MAPSKPSPVSPAPLQPLLDSKQAAALLGISARTLWSLTASAEIRSVRIRRAVRYRLVDLEAYVERHVDRRRPLDDR